MMTQTFADRKYMEGNPKIPKDFNHPKYATSKNAHASKIDWFLKKIKVHESSFF